MKKNFKYISVLLLVFVTIKSYASSSPNELAENLIESFEKYNVVLYESLIYPDTLRKQKEDDLAAYAKKLNSTFKEMRKISEYDSYEIIVRNIMPEIDYKPNSQMIKLIGNKWGLFPVIPTKRLRITAVDKGEVTIYTEQALTKLNGKWYIVWPSKIYDAH